MPDSPLDFEQLAARVETLERQNRRWRRGGAAALVAAAALVLMAQAKPAAPKASAKAAPGVVQAQAFELVDKTGKTIGSLDGREGPEVLRLTLGEDGKERVTLTASAGGSVLSLANSAGSKTTFVVGDNGPAIVLEEPSRQAQAMLAIGKRGAVLSLQDQGQLGAALVAGPSGRAIAIYDAAGKLKWGAPQ